MISHMLHKREMSARVAELMGSTKSGGELALNAVLQSITDAMREGDSVVLTGFGTFRDARGRHPKGATRQRRQPRRTDRRSGAQGRALQGGWNAEGGGERVGDFRRLLPESLPYR